MDHVMFWNSVLLEASRRDHSLGYRNGQQTGPTATSRAMAIVHLAIHDTLAFATDKPSAAYLTKKGIPFTPTPPVGTVLNDAIAGAASTALKALYPAYTAYFDDSIATAAEVGFAFGEKVANALLAARSTDGASAPSPAAAPLTYGSHRPDPYNAGPRPAGRPLGRGGALRGPTRAAEQLSRPQPAAHIESAGRCALQTRFR
jgi:hypothetical protein